jgi:hypothetical protein
LLLISGYTMSQPARERPPAANLAASSADTPLAVGVRIGHTVLPPTATMGALRLAIEEFNKRSRLPGLVDELNPEVIDVDKALALMTAVPALAKKSPKQFAGLELSLSSGSLQIGSANPSLLASFAKPFKLEVVEVKGTSLLARTTVPLMPQLARKRSTEAQRQLVIENQLIEPLEAKLRAAPDLAEQKRAILDELTPALWRRSALARSWLDNARFLNEQPGAGVAEKAEVEAARKAVTDYLLVGAGAGMPGSR